MNLRKLSKENARYALGGNWGKAICIFMISLSIFVIFSLMQGLVCLLSGIPDFQDILSTPSFYLDDSAHLSVLSFSITALFAGLSLLVNSPLRLGVTLWYYRTAEGKKEEVIAIFGFFSTLRLLWKAICYDLTLAVRSVLWGILFLAPAGVVLAAGVALYQRDGISSGVRFGAILLVLLGGLLCMVLSLCLVIFLKRYFLARYLLADRPELTVREALRCSVRATRGFCSELFVLELSYLLWLLSCFFVVPLLYVVPYRGVARALYAKFLIERAATQEPLGTAEKAPPCDTPCNTPQPSSYEEPDKP